MQLSSSPGFPFQSENLRKKASRIEEENDAVMMQLKKMATKARSRRCKILSLDHTFSVLSSML